MECHNKQGTNESDGVRAVLLLPITTFHEFSMSCRFYIKVINKWKRPLVLPRRNDSSFDGAHAVRLSYTLFVAFHKFHTPQKLGIRLHKNTYGDPPDPFSPSPAQRKNGAGNETTSWPIQILHKIGSTGPIPIPILESVQPYKLYLIKKGKVSVLNKFWLILQRQSTVGVGH